MLVAAIGIQDLVIVVTKDAMMVASQDNVQSVKDIFERLRSYSRPEWKLPREVYRPWGKFDSIDRGDRFQVKKITVKPGQNLACRCITIELNTG